MQTQDVKIRSACGRVFDCYISAPANHTRIPAVVLASAIHGVDADLRTIADELAAHGCIAAAPDLFWRTQPGALARGDPKGPVRGQPRLQKIAAGEQDLADVLTYLRELRLFNGQAGVIGFCYGGPYAILGPKRLGYDAGMACHGSQMLDYVHESEGVHQPVCLVWGDQDHLAPPEVRDAYRSLAGRQPNLEVHELPNVRHGYMMRASADGFDEDAHRFSMKRAFAMIDSLRN